MFFFFKIPTLLAKSESKLPSGFAQMTNLVKEYVHQSAKLKRTETELTDSQRNIFLIYVCLR